MRRFALVAIAVLLVSLFGASSARAQMYPGGTSAGGLPTITLTGDTTGSGSGGTINTTTGGLLTGAGGTVNLSDGTHNLAMTMKASLQATPPNLTLTGAVGFGATSANANPGGALTATAGAGGASVTSGTGGAGAIASLVGGAGGASAGGSANANGGNAIWGSSAAGTGGGGAAGLPGTLLAQVGGTTVGQFGQASTDFIAQGGGIVAAAGYHRLINNPGTVLAERNSGNTADIILLSTPNTVDVTLGNWTTGGNINVGSTAGSAFTQTNPGNGTIAIQTATGSLGGTFGFQITNSIVTGPAWGVLPTYNGATTVTMAKTVTTPLYTQAPLATQSATNGAAGVAMTFKSQDGQPATGASNNGGAGGVLNVSSGVGGTSGSATAGVGGALNLQVGGLTVGGYYATPAVGVSIAHSAAATTVLTTPQATSATSTQYTVQAVCRATTLFTGGATTDTFATLQHFTVRNVAGTLTNVSSVTVDTSTQSDSSMSTNALSLSISGTNLNWQITPPALAAGVESCWVTSSAPGPF